VQIPSFEAAFTVVGFVGWEQASSGQLADVIRRQSHVETGFSGVQNFLVGQGLLKQHIDNAVQLLDNLLFAHFNDD
jgi:hypothetical protein